MPRVKRPSGRYSDTAKAAMQGAAAKKEKRRSKTSKRPSGKYSDVAKAAMHGAASAPKPKKSIFKKTMQTVGIKGMS